MKELLQKYTSQASDYIKTLSERERLLLAVAGGVVALFILYLAFSGLTGLYAIFSRQFSALKTAQRNMEITSVLLRDIVQLKSRQEAIEKRAAASTARESALSFIEAAIRNKAGLTAPQGFRVNPGQTLALTAEYEQVPYIISFDINELQPVAALLKELASGPHAIMVSALDLRYFPGQSIVKVEIRATTIRRASSDGAET